MRNFLAAALIFVSLMAAWVWLAFQDGSFDRAEGIMAQSKLVALDRQPASGQEWLLWMGDSVSYVCMPEKADQAQGSLLAMLRAGYKRRMLVGAVEAGQAGPQYEVQAYRCARLRPPPKVAVITLNIRSFYPKGGFQTESIKLPPEEEVARPLDWNEDPWRADKDARPGSPGPAAWLERWRELCVWTRETLQVLLVPAKLQEAAGGAGKAGDPLPFKRIYGRGARPDLGRLSALVRAGRRLRRAGTQVVYWAVPLDWNSMRKELSRQELRRVESALARAREGLAAEGFQVIDLSHFVDKGFFGPPSEHLDGPARAKVAAALCAVLP